MEQAIKKAIEGGYKFSWHEAEQIVIRFRGYGRNTEMKMMTSFVLLDPLFWQALSRVWHKENPGNLDWGGECECWKDEWHKFINHLAEGKDTDSFFTSLLAPQGNK